MAKDKTTIEEKEDTRTERDRALDLVFSTIEKEYGKGSIFNGSSSFPDIEYLPTGCLSLDRALGGGFARGRIAEIAGGESSGKTSISLHVASEVQKKDGLVAFIDAEHALDFFYCKKLGVDIDKLLISQPSSAEEALNIVDMLSQSGIIDLIIVDSVAALVPSVELAGDIGDAHMAVLARLMSQTLRKITGIVSKTNTTIIFINQLRDKIGAFSFGQVGAGGNALKFYASQRLDIRTTGKSKIGEEIVGQTTKVKVIKNKVAQPFKEAEFGIEHGRGINKYADILSIAVSRNIIDKSGAWYSYNGERVGQGEPNSVQWLMDHPVEYQAIYDKCKTEQSI